MDEEGSTLLHFGCSQNKPKVVKMLLKKGASVNTKDKKGWTPLHCAAYDKHLNICQLLLKYNADPTIQNTSQTTATFYVVRCKEEFVFIFSFLFFFKSFQSPAQLSVILNENNNKN